MIDAATIGIVDEPFLRARQPYGAFLESHRGVAATRRPTRRCSGGAKSGARLELHVVRPHSFTSGASEPRAVPAHRPLVIASRNHALRP